MGAHSRRDLVAPLELRKPCERICHPFQRQCEGEDAAPVYCGPDLVFGNLRRLGVDGEHLPLHAVALEPVTLAPPAPCPTEREHPGVLPGTIVLEPGRRLTARPALELVFGRRRLGQ